MKKIFIAFSFASLFFVSCAKHVEVAGTSEPGRIVFCAENNATKSVVESTASTLESNGFKVAAVTGTTTFFNENVSWNSSEDWFETATTYYYPSTSTDFYAVYPKTQAITVATGVATLSYTSDNNTDLIAAKSTGVSARSTALPLTFDHILSQLVVKCQGSDTNVDYVVKSVSVANTNAATYAYATGTWSGTNKSKVTSVVSSNTSASTAFMTTMGEAVTVVPAEVDLRIIWDCKQGSTVVGSYDETVSFTPTVGKVCTVNCTLPNKDAKSIKFTINVNPWGEENINLSLERVANITIDDTFSNSLANIATKSTGSTPIDVDYILDGLEEEAEVKVIMSDGEFSVSTDISDFSSPETDGGKIYLTSNSDETKGYSYEIYYEGGEWKIKNTGYLIFEAITDGEIKWETYNSSATESTIYYSKDGGESWSEWTSTSSGSSLNVLAGETIFIKGSSNTLNTGIYDYSRFIYGSTSNAASFYAYGNIDALINYSDLSTRVYYRLFYGDIFLYSHPTKKLLLPSMTLAEFCYNGMFSGCTNLSIAPVLPATTLTQYCYGEMFRDCTSLSSAPDLPATTLAAHCYDSMFFDCTGLAVSPALPATTLATACYAFMFSGCTGLLSAPALPATTLATNCYQRLFYSCTGLTSAPELPATKLVQACYYEMFYNCTGLTSAPELPATILANSCYYGMFKRCTSLLTAPVLLDATIEAFCLREMFYGCSNLSYVKAMYTTGLGTNSRDWLYGVSPTGTFVKNSNAVWTTTGANGVPSGWTVQTATE